MKERKEYRKIKSRVQGDLQKDKNILGKTLGICKRTSELEEFAGSMYELQNEVNAKVRRLIDWGSIYINGIATSGKFPAPFSTRASAIGFASPRRT